jgi:peptide/nickel transport system permease protein
MTKSLWIGQRLLQLIPVLIGISIISFTLIQMIPGDPARLMLGPKASPEAVAAVRERLGLDLPALSRYFQYMGNLLQGDLGDSYRYQMPVLDLILERLPVTAFLALYVMVLSIPTTLLLGRAAGRRSNTWVDHSIRMLSVLGMTVPVFWLAVLMLRLFSIDLGWFPVGGYGEGFIGHLHHLFLPAVSTAIWVVPVLVRNLRAAIIEESLADYVTASRAKGLPENYIFSKHVLRNASLPTLNLLGVMVIWLIGGTVIVELVYAIPGLGTLMFNAILARDFVVIQSLTLFYAVTTVTITLLTDLVSGFIDPRLET